MQIFSKNISMLVALILLAPLAVEAEGFYGGLNAGVGMPDLRTPNGVNKDYQAVAGAVAGYKFNEYFGVEGQYTGVGKVTDNVKGSAKADALSLDAVAFVPIDISFNLIGKLGVASTQSTVSGMGNYKDASKTGVTYGIGAEYHFNKNVSMRASWDFYQAAVGTPSGNISMHSDVTTIGAFYYF